MSLSSLVSTESGPAASSTADKKSDGKPKGVKQPKPVKVMCTDRRKRFDDSTDLRIRDCIRGCLEGEPDPEQASQCKDI